MHFRLGMLYFSVLLLTSSVVVNGESNSFFNSIYDSFVQTQQTLKEVAVTVNEGLKKVATAMKFIEKFIDATVEEDCVFKCPSNKMAIPNEEYKPSYNGCGSLGAKFERGDLTQPEMEDCCNEHDLCYDDCGSEKEICDSVFKRCLYSTCEEKERELDRFAMKKCKGGAKLLYTAVLALGCTSYIDSQKEACRCVSHSDKRSKRKTEL